MSSARTIDLLAEDRRLEIDRESFVQCLLGLDAFLGDAIPSGSLHVAFITPETCSDLHGRFFGDQDITDVMTFPGDPEDGHAGDIAICPLVAHTESASRGLDFSAELTLYLVHACLHLGGWDDQDETQSAAMRLQEERCLNALRSQQRCLRASWKGDLTA